MRGRRENTPAIRGQCPAIAVFVKTPGLSPVKTRLAATLGEETSREFYLRAVRATEALVGRFVAENPGATPFWAVAEEAALGHPLWRSFARIRQGEGPLGDRLGRVYEDLFRAHRPVILIGADCPLLSPSHLRDAYAAIASPGASGAPFVLGPATDGGFYLFGGRRPLPRDLWSSIPYSAPDTSARLEALVSRRGALRRLPALPDVDTEEDLFALPPGAPDALEPQAELLAWAARLRARAVPPAASRVTSPSRDPSCA